MSDVILATLTIIVLSYTGLLLYGYGCRSLLPRRENNHFGDYFFREKVRPFPHLAKTVSRRFIKNKT